VQHGANGGDAGSGGNENGIAHRRVQDEIAEWSLAAELFAVFHVAKEVRHEAVLYAVHAKGNATVFRRGRSDRVSSCEFFAIRQDVLDRKPLPGYESKAWHALDLEVEMLG